MKVLFFLAAIGTVTYVSTCKIKGAKEKETEEKLSKTYSSANYDSLKKYVVVLKKHTSDAKRKDSLVTFMYKKMFPFWYDTEWDFNGTTTVPRQGNIACGYFVTTVLRDAGVKLDRVALAQAASESMIKTLTTEDHIKRFSNIKIEKFCEDVKKFGKGVFVVGLDSHTGFLLNSGDSLFFIHANGYGWNPKKVIKEYALNSTVLSVSKYRVVGLLTEDEKFLENWKK